MKKLIIVFFVGSIFLTVPCSAISVILDENTPNNGWVLVNEGENFKFSHKIFNKNINKQKALIDRGYGQWNYTTRIGWGKNWRYICVSQN